VPNSMAVIRDHSNSALEAQELALFRGSLLTGSIRSSVLKQAEASIFVFE
jgi:hypothetical protein